MTFFSSLSAYLPTSVTSYMGINSQEGSGLENPPAPGPAIPKTAVEAFQTTQKPLLEREADATTPTPTGVNLGTATQAWICRGWAQHALNGLDWVTRIAYGISTLANSPEVDSIVNTTKEALKEAEHSPLPQSLRATAALLNCYKAQKEISAAEGAPATIKEVNLAIKTTKRWLEDVRKAPTHGTKEALQHKQNLITEIEKRLASLELLKTQLTQTHGVAKKGPWDMASNAARAGAAGIGVINDALNTVADNVADMPALGSALLKAAPVLELPNAIRDTQVSISKLATSKQIYEATLEVAEQTGSPELQAIAHLIGAEHSYASRVGNVIYNGSRALGRAASTVLATTLSLEQLGVIPEDDYAIESIGQKVATGMLVVMGTTAVGLLAYRTWERQSAKSQAPDIARNGETAAQWIVGTLKGEGDLKQPVHDWLLKIGIDQDIINTVIDGKMDEKQAAMYIKGKLKI